MCIVVGHSCNGLSLAAQLLLDVATPALLEIERRWAGRHPGHGYHKASELEIVRPF